VTPSDLSYGTAEWAQYSLLSQIALSLIFLLRASYNIPVLWSRRTDQKIGEANTRASAEDNKDLVDEVQQQQSSGFLLKE